MTNYTRVMNNVPQSTYKSIDELEAMVQGLDEGMPKGEVSMSDFVNLGVDLNLKDDPHDNVSLNRVRDTLKNSGASEAEIERAIKNYQEKFKHSLKGAVKTKSSDLENALIETYDCLGLPGYESDIVIKIPGSEAKNTVGPGELSYDFKFDKKKLVGSELADGKIGGEPDLIRYHLSMGGSNLQITASYDEVIIRRDRDNLVIQMYRNISRLFTISVGPQNDSAISKFFGYKRIQFATCGDILGSTTAFLTQYTNRVQKSDNQSKAFAYALENLEKALNISARENTYKTQKLNFNNQE